MNQYWKNDYAMNKGGKDEIVYLSVTGEVIVITKNQFLERNPEMTEGDFYKIKDFSDEDYKERCNKDHCEERHSVFLSEEMENVIIAAFSPEDMLIAELENQCSEESNQKLRKAIDDVWNIELTEVQRKRLKLSIDGMTVREIAANEGKAINAVEKSLKFARNKFANILRKLK